MARERKATERNTRYAVLGHVGNGWEVVTHVESHSATAAAQLVAAGMNVEEQIVLKVVPARSWDPNYTVEPEVTRRYQVAVTDAGTIVAVPEVKTESEGE